jgi:hypothetical protein
MRAFIDALERLLSMVLLAIVWCLTIRTKTQHPNHKGHPKISKHSTKFQHQSIINGQKQQLAQQGSHSLLPEVSHEFLSDDSVLPLENLRNAPKTQREK